MHSPNDSTKTCTKCFETKPLDAFYLDKRTGKPRGQCADCVCAYSKARYRANPEPHKALIRAWGIANRDKRREDGTRRRAANPEIHRAAVRKWRKNHPEAARADSRKAHHRHRAERNRKAKIYYAANREEALANAAAWRKANPEKMCDYSRARQARKRGAPVVEDIRRADIWERDGGICYLCGLPCDPDNWHLEHLIPLSRGGNHSADNVAASHPECNRAKGTRTPDELRHASDS